MTAWRLGWAAVAALALTAAALAPGTRREPRADLHYQLAASKSMTLTGSVSGLYPGLTRQLTVTITNPQTFAVTITQASVTAGAATASCGTKYLTAGPVAGLPLTIPTGGAGQVTAPITLTPQSPDACQRVQFPLSFAAVAVKS